MKTLLLAVLLSQANIGPAKIHNVDVRPAKNECKITEDMRKFCGHDRVPVIWNVDCAWRCDKAPAVMEPAPKKGKK